MTPVPHDFRKPIRLQALWQNRLTGWLRAALSLASKSWEKQFGAGIQASFKDLHVAFAHDALNNLPDGTIGHRIQAAGDSLTTLLALPRGMLLGLIGILLGSGDSPAEDRELTMVEENLADYILAETWLHAFRDTWPGDQIIPWRLHERDCQPQCSRIFAASDVLVVLDFTVKGPWGEHPAWWHFPQKDLLDLLDGGAAKADAVPEADISRRREALVQSFPMTVQVSLGSAALTLSQLSNLRVGDVVLLEQRTGDPIVAHAGDTPVFKGKPGRLGSWRAIQIDAARVK